MAELHPVKNVNCLFQRQFDAITNGLGLIHTCTIRKKQVFSLSLKLK